MKTSEEERGRRDFPYRDAAEMFGLAGQLDAEGGHRDLHRGEQEDPRRAGLEPDRQDVMTELLILLGRSWARSVQSEVEGCPEPAGKAFRRILISSHSWAPTAAGLLRREGG